MSIREVVENAVRPIMQTNLGYPVLVSSELLRNCQKLSDILREICESEDQNVREKAKEALRIWDATTYVFAVSGRFVSAGYGNSRSISSVD